MKFIRYQARYVGRTGKPVGVFTAFHHLKNSARITDADWRQFDEIDRWFKAHLQYPPYYERGNPEGAITWFKSGTSDAMVARLGPLSEILSRYGVALDIARTDEPGVIVYEDDYQVGVIGEAGEVLYDRANVV